MACFSPARRRALTRPTAAWRRLLGRVGYFLHEQKVPGGSGARSPRKASVQKRSFCEGIAFPPARRWANLSPSAWFAGAAGAKPAAPPGGRRISPLGPGRLYKRKEEESQRLSSSLLVQFENRHRSVKQICRWHICSVGRSGCKVNWAAGPREGGLGHAARKPALRTITRPI